MMRPLVFDFQNETTVYGIEDQFRSVGPALLVSPVTAMGATSRSVYLPAGTWLRSGCGIDYDGGRNHDDGQRAVEPDPDPRPGRFDPRDGPMIQLRDGRASRRRSGVTRRTRGSPSTRTMNDTYNYETGQ